MGTPIEGGQVQGDPENTPGPNPAWESVLNIIPEEFHGAITPEFQKWDQAAQSRIEQVNNSLKEYEAYKPFHELGISADEIEQGLRLMYEINNNPQSVYDALASAYNFGQQQTPEEGPNPEELPEGITPELMEKLNSQEGTLKALAQIVLNDAQAKQDAQAEAELDRELNELRERIGDFDENYVTALMLNGASAEEAGNAFVALKQSLSPKPFAPTVLGNSNGGTGLPSNAIDPTKLTSKDTRSLVVQMLAAANQEN
jgi:hypothetical protein